MNFYYWLIVIIPLAFVIGIGIYSRRYVNGVVEFLAAGRVAGRYLLSVASLEGSIGVVTLISFAEMHYQTGFALSFWSGVMLPLSIFLSLTGYVYYRLRETKALSMGQFLEMRYSRNLRIIAVTLRTFSEMLCNCIGPAVAARFFIYLLGLPHDFVFCGVKIQTFMIMIIICLILANILIMSGGVISLMITDCLQGIICYPIFVIFVVFMLIEFSWFGEITPVMNDRIAGESFLNPYDISQLRDFNLFALFVSIISYILGRGNWFGGGSSSAAKSAHEQKMVGILGSFRSGFSQVMILVMTASVITFMSHRDFAEPAHQTRLDLSQKVTEELVVDPQVRQQVIATIQNLPQQTHVINQDSPLSQKHNIDTFYLDAIHQKLRTAMPDDVGAANAIFQGITSLYRQMMMPIAFRHILPPVLFALFILLGIMLMVSTDDSRIFASAISISQDIILPLKKKPFTPEQHIRCIKLMVIFVSVCFAIGSMFLAQIDFINLFIIISASIWTGGAGSVIVFGLYSRYGTTAGAYAALITGAVISGGGMLIQRFWADLIYPFLDGMGWIPTLAQTMNWISQPLNPYVVWEMNPVKFPINSNEIMFISMMVSILSYWLVSFFTHKQPFNLERMLHRGIYNTDHESKTRVSFTWKKFLTYFVNITPEYTRGDRIITWSVFGYSIVYRFILGFLGVIVWNIFSPWPLKWWGYHFFITFMLVPSIVGVISTVWFSIGGVIDMRRLFRDLEARRNQSNILDNGTVEGNVSLADKALLTDIEKSTLKSQEEQK